MTKLIDSDFPIGQYPNDAAHDIGQSLDCDGKTQRVLLFLGVGFSPLMFLGLLLAHSLPPTSPNASAVEVAQTYTRHHVSVQIGALILMIGGVGWGLYGAVRTYWLWRMERGRFPFMALLSATFVAANAALTVFAFTLFALLAYRAGDIDPALTRMLNDFTTFMLIYIVSPMMVEVFAATAAILRDRQRLFPRWMAWVNLATGVLVLPGGFIGFTKSGPFAWNGILGFWLVMVVFGVWAGLEAMCILRAIANQERRNAVVIPGLA